MSINTLQDRFAIMQFCGEPGGLMPPTGSVDAGARAIMLGLYQGFSTPVGGGGAALPLMFFTRDI